MLFELPVRWEEREFGAGDRGLFALGHETMHVLAPPGVAFLMEESRQQTTRWRHALWTCEEEFPPVISLDPPTLIEELGTAAVVEMLPTEAHDFVRAAMARQLRLASLYSAFDELGCRYDKEAQRAGRVCSWTIAELLAAFPEERWYREEELAVEIPGTVEEVLEMMPRSLGKAELPVAEAPQRWGPFTRYRRHKLGLRIFCRLVVEDVRYSLLLRLMPSREDDLKPELRESQQHLRDSPGEVLNTGA
jgi:hypothetical protein